MAHSEATSDLLHAAIEAHGGLERFKRISEVEFTVDVGGMMWAVKGYPGHRHVTVIVDVTTPKVTHYNLTNDPSQADVKWIWTPDRVWVEAPDGSVLESRDAPRAAFDGHTLPTPWDDLHLLYFSGYAMWNYTMAPFYFLQSGMSTREVDGLTVGNQTWRALEVIYPDGFPTHCKEQKFYFDASNRLRRLEYSAEVLKAKPVAHDCLDHRVVNGITFPMLRRAVVLPDGLDNGGPSMVLLNFHRIVVREKEEVKAGL